MKPQNSNNDYGWVDDGDNQSHREPAFTPDMSALIDPPDVNAVPQDEILPAMAKIMRGIFEFCFESTKHGHPDLNHAFRHFVGAVWVLCPDLLGHSTLTDLAPELGVTRACLSNIGRKFADRFQVRGILMKRESARGTYSAARIAYLARQKKKKPGTPCEMPGPGEQDEQNPHSEACI